MILNTFIACVLLMLGNSRIAKTSSCTVQECESRKRKYASCSVSQIPANQIIVSTSVKERISNSDCEFGTSYGFLTTSIWVDNGCRAKFTICFGFPSMVSVDGNWGIWTTWSECSATCGNGTTIRTRLCDNPVPLNGGQNCYGKSSETTICQIDICSASMCACSCPIETCLGCQYNNSSVGPDLNEIQIDPKSTNQAKRRKTSAKDDRLSSVLIGLAGAAICSIPFVFAVIVDAMNLLQ